MNENYKIIEKLIDKIKKQKNADMGNSYTAKLFSEGKVKIANKLGEESTETISAFLCQQKEDICEEASDLIYHLLVLLEHAEISFSDILKVLEKRMTEKQE